MKAVFLSKVFTEEQCKKIISFHSAWPSHEGYIGGENSILDTNHRQCMVYVPPSLEYVPNWLITQISKMVHDTNKKYYNFNLGQGNVEGKTSNFELNLLQYEIGGHQGIHMDLGEGQTTSFRKISFSLILNDSYKGGNLTFNVIPEISQIKPEIGDVIIFPSYLEHRVEPVTSGIRWTLVGWILGDKQFE